MMDASTIEKLPRVALLVDGENVASEHAGSLLAEARRRGRLVVARVYGCMMQQPGWAGTPGYLAIHSETGKNCADIRLAIDGVDLWHRHRPEVILIASSDGGLTSLAHYLRQRGGLVVGLGLKPSELLRAACDEYIVLRAAKSVANRAPKTDEEKIEDKVTALIRECGGARGLKIQSLGTLMKQRHEVLISKHPDKTWRSFLTRRAELFDCDAKSSDACVRLRRAT